MQNILIGTCAAIGLAVAGIAPAAASSELLSGHFQEIDPAGPSYDGAGTCTLVTGPRDGLKAGEFVLTAGNRHAPDDSALRLTGTFSATEVNGRVFYTLAPDLAAAGKHIEDVLRAQSHDSGLSFLLRRLDASVTAVKAAAVCSVRAVGTVSGTGGAPAEAKLIYAGSGLYYPSSDPLPGAVAVPPPVQAVDNNPPCPTTMPVQKALAPLGLNPVPGKCSPGSCLVNFAGYQWWTSFQFYGPPGNPVFPGGGYFYNGGQGTAYAPTNSFVDAQGQLHLQSNLVDLGGGKKEPTGAESVLMFKPDGTQANLGYGDYLVAAKVTTAADWASLDPNLAFGVFQFERVGSGSVGGPLNPAREIDLAEISTWGKFPPSNCPYVEKRLCEGTSQFTLQIWDKRPENLFRYTIKPGVNTVTLVMRWHAKNMPVTFEQYNGAYTLTTLPATPDNSWTTTPAQNGYVPEPACGRFHLNLWFGNYKDPSVKKQFDPHPGPARYPQDVTVTNFQFQPVQ